MYSVRYDKTFDGLLNVVFFAFSSNNFPVVLLGQDEVTLLGCTDVETVHTNANRAARVFAGLRQRLSRLIMEDVLKAWQSEVPGADLLLFRFFCAVFLHGGNKADDYGNRDILAMQQLARKVYCEYRSLLGFARFQQSREGLYFCAVRPRYNVVPLMVSHFVDRFADQPWILFDVGREFGVYYLPETGRLQEIFMETATLASNGLPLNLLADSEQQFQHLWKGYCEAIAIPERRNPKLQTKLLPRKYWQYLIEHHPNTQG